VVPSGAGERRADDLPGVVDTNGVASASAQRAQVGDDVLGPRPGAPAQQESHGREARYKLFRHRIPP